MRVVTVNVMSAAPSRSRCPGDFELVHTGRPGNTVVAAARPAFTGDVEGTTSP